jgi:hypothetical protein
MRWQQFKERIGKPDAHHYGWPSSAVAGAAMKGTSKGALPETATPRRVITLDDLVTIEDLEKSGASLEWVWEGWIQKNVLNIVASNAGDGKTRFVADLVRRIRNGMTWPDGSPMTLPPDSLVLWAACDNHHAELVSLCGEFGIKKNVVINARKSDPFGGTTMDNAEDRNHFLENIEAAKPVLVIIDTIGNSTDLNLCKQEEAKQYFQPLQIIARRGKVPLLALAHLNATGGVLGRRATEKVRVVIRMEKPDPEGQPNRRKLEVTKSNGKYPAALGITMGDGGNDYDNTPPCKPDVDPMKAIPPARLEECVNWLQDKLGDGKRQVGKIRSAADDAKFSSKTLYKARDQLAVIETRSGGKLWWELPN